MKVKIEAIIDLGDDFCEWEDKDEVIWANRCISQTDTIFLSDGEGTGSNMDYFPLKMLQYKLMKENL
jgi:hypothetical protein